MWEVLNVQHDNMYVWTYEVTFSPVFLPEGACFARQLIPEHSLYLRITLVLAVVYMLNVEYVVYVEFA